MEPAGGDPAKKSDDAAKRLAHLAPLDDQVELTVLEQELRALEALRQRLADGLGDDPRPGEADEGPRLGENRGRPAWRSWP